MIAIDLCRAQLRLGMLFLLLLHVHMLVPDLHVGINSGFTCKNMYMMLHVISDYLFDRSTQSAMNQFMVMALQALCFLQVCDVSYGAHTKNVILHRHFSICFVVSR